MIRGTTTTEMRTKTETFGNSFKPIANKLHTHYRNLAEIWRFTLIDSLILILKLKRITMRIAIEGCTHGELEKTYETIAAAEKEAGGAGNKIDLLLCCGDFQSTRNLADLRCMAVPDKYKEMCSFYKYYSGEKVAPVLTIFIGGNHEASNYLQELPYGGWVAHNIFYMGYAGVISVSGLRIGGLSGIYKGCDYLRGHFETPPYDNSSMRSVYHIRNLETFRLKQLARSPPDIMLSHDWPRGVYKYGDVDQLLRCKRHFHDDIANDTLGSRPTQEVMETLKPSYWFSAHLHVKFAAIVEHGDSPPIAPSTTAEAKNNRTTKFLALDKCLPKRRFLQILDIGPEVESEAKLSLEYDSAWLAVLRSTNDLLSVEATTNHMPGPGYSGRHDFSPTEEEIATVRSLFDGDLGIPLNFAMSVPAYDNAVETMRDMHRTPMPMGPQRNPQTVSFCAKLGVPDPCELAMQKRGRQMLNVDFSHNKSASDEKSTFLSINADEIALDDDEEEEEEEEEGGVSRVAGVIRDTSETLMRLPELKLPAPRSKVDNSEGKCEVAEAVAFVIDSTPDPTKTDNPSQREQERGDAVPKKKVLKRRNQAIYAQNEDE